MRPIERRGTLESKSPDRQGRSKEALVSGSSTPWLPPRWFIRLFWLAHRRFYRLTGGRAGLWRPKPGKWGALRLRTIGRRTGREHPVIVGYLEDGPAFVTMAMNGWGDAEPAWWLNLQAHPDVRADLPDGAQLVVRARAAEGEERERLWNRWRAVDRNLDAYAARRSMETAVVILEPRPEPEELPLQTVPEPLRAERHLTEPDAGRRVDGVGDGGRGRDDRRLADALGAERAVLRWHLDDDRVDRG
jgi:deazaflavin-dependent oxidoreductase (nitroreductase family)